MTELSKLGRYELRRVLGRGAMGMVYEGFDPSLNRAVAVKTILKSIVTDEETAGLYSARFAREAKAVARLSHSHIVRVYDFGEENDVAYLVMEFIEGRELRGYFEDREIFSVAESVRIMGELLEALEFAHEAGVIHRDVKPANVMLDAQRRVKLADFGVARIQDGTDRSKTGTMVGTPAFMSPEQISGGKIDRRTDLFSAGIVLYELLTGEQPFKGKGAWTVAKMIMHDEPARPSTVAGKISPAFDAVVSKALAKKPDQRFASAAEFAAALKSTLGEEQGAASAPRASDTELEFWRSIQGSTDPAEFELYLRKFPQGAYAELAQLKRARLRAAPGELRPENRDLATLTQETAKLGEALAAREAEYRKREAEAEVKRLAAEKARAEADAKLEAELKLRAAAEEKSRLEAIEKARQEASAELAKREEEFRKREAESAAKAEAETKARREAEEKARNEAVMRTRAEAEARATREVEERARRDAEIRVRAEAEALVKMKAEESGRLAAELAKREAELKKREAEGVKAKAPVVPVLVSMAIILAAAIGGWYWHSAGERARVAELTAALEAATKATQDLDLARQRQEELRKQVEASRLAEADAKASGDTAKLKELHEATRRAEAEAAKQAEVVKQRETAKAVADQVTTAKSATDRAAADKAAADKAAAEKIATEKAAAEKIAAEKAAEEKAAAEKIAAAKAGAQKAAVEKTVAKASSRKEASGKMPMPSVGDLWTYEIRVPNRPNLTQKATVEALSVSPSIIADVFRPESGSVLEWKHQPGVYSVYLSPNASMFSPYLLSFQEIREGQQWSDVPVAGTGSCTTSVDAYCKLNARVIGRETVTVKAGAYSAWKIVVEAMYRGRGGSFFSESTYWFAEAPRRYVKFQRRYTGGNIGQTEEIDMELLSYAPAAGDRIAPEKAAAGKKIYEDSALEQIKLRHPNAEFLMQEPSVARLRSRGLMYVNDGSCPEGEIKEVTGGDVMRMTPSITRCVKLTE